MQRLPVSVSILGELSASSGRSYHRPVSTKRLLLCNQACFVSFSLNLECPLKRIVLLHEIWSRRSVASRRGRNLELLRRSS